MMLKMIGYTNRMKFLTTSVEKAAEAPSSRAIQKETLWTSKHLSKRVGRGPIFAEDDDGVASHRRNGGAELPTLSVRTERARTPPVVNMPHDVGL